MNRSDYWLVFRTEKTNWRVYSDIGGILIHFTSKEAAEEAGKRLLENGVAEGIWILHAPMAWYWNKPPMEGNIVCSND